MILVDARLYGPVILILAKVRFLMTKIETMQFVHLGHKVKLISLEVFFKLPGTQNDKNHILWFNSMIHLGFCIYVYHVWVGELTDCPLIKARPLSTFGNQSQYLHWDLIFRYAAGYQ